MPHATIETFIPMVAAPQLPLKRAGQLLGAMSEGRRLVLMPTEQEFTAVEAANFLNVSRPSPFRRANYAARASIRAMARACGDHQSKPLQRRAMDLIDQL